MNIGTTVIPFRIALLLALACVVGCNNDEKAVAGPDATLDSEGNTGADTGADGGVDGGARAACTTHTSCKGGYCRGAGTAAAACAPCLLDSHCAEGKRCLVGQCVTGATCQSDKACTGFDAVCDVKAGLCVACITDGDCAAGACTGGRCAAGVVPCGSSKDCKALAAVCDSAKGICVDCVGNVDCDDKAYCLAGSCHADLCSAGSKACSEDKTAVLTCSAAGDQLIPVACGAGETCAAGVCVAGQPAVCKSGAKMCVNQDVMVCKTDGSAWTKSSTCGGAQVCAEGACVANTCTAGSKACKGAEVWVCAADGSASVKLAICPKNTVCSKGECVSDTAGVVCTAGSKTCKGDEVWVCAADGKSTTKLAACPTATTCDKGQCVSSGVCAVGQIKCDGDKLQTCGVGGGWATTSCDDGSPCTVDSCAIAKAGCVHTQVSDGTVCVGGKCMAGTCVVPCKPGEFIGKAQVLYETKSSVLYASASTKHFAIARDNEFSTYGLSYVGYSAAGKVLWQTSPSTATYQQGCDVQAMDDATTVAMQSDRLVQGSQSALRLLRFDAAGKLLANTMVTKKNLNDIHTANYLIKRANSSWLVRGRYTAADKKTKGELILDLSLSLKIVSQQQVQSTFSPVSPYSIGVDAKGQLWGEVTSQAIVAGKTVYVNDLRQLDVNGSVTQALPSLTFPQQTGVNWLPMRTKTRIVALAQSTDVNGTKSQFVITQSAQDKWSSGPALSSATYGWIYLGRGLDWQDGDGVATLGWRHVVATQLEQPIVVRLTGAGAMKSVTGFPAGNVTPRAVMQHGDGTMTMLTSSTAVDGKRTVALQKMCAL